jgi:hypothetical protein
MPTGNYSLMVMEKEHMVYGDGLGGGSGEVDVEIPLACMERNVNVILETEIMVVVMLQFMKDSVPPGR